MTKLLPHARLMLLPMLLSALALSTQAPFAFAQPEQEVTAARPYTVRFIDEMTSHHKHGAMMSQLAEGRAFHPELKRMARMMLMDQQKEIQELQSIRERSYPRVEKPADRGAGMNLNKLRVQRGVAFDLAFIDSMIAHHPAAIYLGQEAAQRSGHPEIRQMGRNISSKQKKELEQLRVWRDAWARH